MTKISHGIILAFISSGACSNIHSVAETKLPFIERSVASEEIPLCNGGCPKDNNCINSFTTKGSLCVTQPAEAPMADLVLPFDNETEVVCTHSSGSGSHSGTNAFYALDLATEYDQSAAVVRAAADGTAYVFLGDDGKPCPEPAGGPASAETSTCGQSWGNRVRILHGGGYLSFYVHLDRALVKNGATVRKGDPIGVMGWTGAAGHRHLHWSIQRLPGLTAADWVEHISWAGDSVPFRFRANQGGKINLFEAAAIKCAHAKIGAAPSETQPRFRGL